MFTRREIRERHAKFMPGVYVALATAALIAGWGVFVLKTAYGVNLVGMSDQRSRELRTSTSTPTSNGVELALAVIATAVAPILIYKAWSARHLALHGHEAAGRVTSVSPLRKGGMSPVTVEYDVGGRAYTTKEDYLAGGVAAGDNVWVVYDPKKPSRCFVIWKEQPGPPSPP